MKIRAYLLLMAVAIAIPIFILSTVALNLLLDSERRAALRNLHEIARATALLVDRELSSAESALRVLASSPHLASGDMRHFYEHAKTADQGEGGRTILFAPDGQQIINTGIPLETPLPPPPPYVTERTQQVIQSQKTIVSNLIIGAVQQRPITTINIPVPLEQGRRYVLGAAFGTDYFQKLIERYPSPPTWTVAVMDRGGRFIARSGSPLGVIGSPADPAIVHKAVQTMEGQLQYRNTDGVDAYEAFTRSPMSGWTISVSAPKQEIEASARKALLAVSLGLLAALVFAVGAAALFGRRLANSIMRATQSAIALGHGKVPEPHGACAIEVDELHRALKSAGMILAASEAERAALLKSEQKARQEAEQQNRSKDEFLAMLGHELRNPLSGIVGAVELMEIEGIGEKSKNRARAILRRQTRHLTHIVDDLLDLARLSKGKIKLDLQTVDLGKVVQSAVEALRTAGKIEHALTLDVASVPIMADRTRLEQIINNLLTNALKYTPAGGSIRVRVYAEENDAVLVVQDTGIGISAELLPRLFDIFTQGAVSLDRSKGGLGIGLSLVRRLVELHRGTVTAESPGQGLGSIFTVRLPCAEQTVAMHENQAIGRTRTNMPCTVLLIEDNNDARHVLAEKLSAEGLRVLEAVDGRAGIQMALAELPDIAVIDIGLPELTGYEVARHLRADAKTSGIGLIALTGYGQEADKLNALNVGFDSHFVKPVQFERLMAMIRKLSTKTSVFTS